MNMKKIVLLLILSFASAAIFGQLPTDSLGLKLGMTRDGVVETLNNRGIKYSITEKDEIRIGQSVISVGSEFDNCTLSFKKNVFVEVSFVKILPASQSNVMNIKFNYLSKQISEHFLMRRYSERLKNGMYNGWTNVNKQNVQLRIETEGDSQILRLIYSSQKLF